MKTQIERLENWIEKFYEINGTPTLDEIKAQISMLKAEPTSDERLARELLESLGYFVGNLWQVADVQGKFNCTDEEAQEVLENAFENDATYEQIWMSIDYAAENLGLEEIEV